MIIRILVRVMLGMGLAGLAGAAEEPAATSAAAARRIDFSRQVRPLLSNNCFRCHGPDETERQSGLRLDQRDAALAPADSGRKAVVPGQPERSELVRRVFSADPAEVMPPPETNKKLSDADKALLRDWISQGARFEQHWAFVPPVRPAVPAVKRRDWPRNPIDDFVAARLEELGLQPSAEADRATLARRLSLDLTGLPPDPELVDAFVRSTAPDAYEQLVERLLNSPHYGERMALDWLDASRFADTHGYHIDSGRDMTRWREWVIASFNQNKPFDEFTIEQLAGDLLPGATREQILASGFNRNHMINFEGGAIPEEYLTAYIVDRVNTTGTVWLGLTIGCAQCHEHKYDPISQREFYQLFSFFHNVDEKGLDGSKGNAAPVLKVPDAEQERQLAEIDRAVARAESRLAGSWPEADAAQSAWEASALAESSVTWEALDPIQAASRGGATLAAQPDKSLLVTGQNPPTDVYVLSFRGSFKGLSALRLETLADPALNSNGPGRSANGNLVLTDVKVTLRPAGAAEQEAMNLPLKDATADFSQQDFAIIKAIDDNPKTGWAIFPEVGKAHAAIFELEQPVTLSEPAQLVVTLAFESQYAQHQAGRIRLSRTSSAHPHGAATLPADLGGILIKPADERSPAERAQVAAHFRRHVFPAGREVAAELAGLHRRRAQLEAVIPTSMVMRELDKPRETFVLIRGQYDKKGEPVAAGVPAIFPPLPKELPANRLGLARWLVDRSHPLTARVTVNRVWQSFFGTGLVKTSEDFGSQGEPPSHPELLDWLAVEFMAPPEESAASGGKTQAWDVRALVRLIVTSATYRQSSAATPELLARDPENRLLARGPRFRLQAEFIRDAALAAAGLLNRRIGGPSVSPYQPPGLWEELMSRADGANWTAQTYVQSHGADLYRRTMYTFWKRTCPPPTLATFDAPDRETCTVRRARTNTPLQALILLNDPTYVEASRKLAERMMREAGPDPAARARFAFRQATSRDPSQQEVEPLVRLFARQVERFRNDKQAAERLLAVGESPHDTSLPPAELAAWSVVASVVLNLDETLTKG